jgi:hypothetical protein
MVTAAARAAIETIPERDVIRTRLFKEVMCDLLLFSRREPHSGSR